MLPGDQPGRAPGVVHAASGWATPTSLDGAFYSCALGVAKPDPAYFAAVLDLLALPPERVLLVDDNPANVAAARSVGLAAEAWSCREDPALLRAHLARHGVLP